MKSLQSRLVKEGESDRGVRTQVDRVPNARSACAGAPARVDAAPSIEKRTQPAAARARHPSWQEVLQLDPEGGLSLIACPAVPGSGGR